MSVRNLEALLAPASVAVIGVSDRPDNLGHVVLRNLQGSVSRGRCGWWTTATAILDGQATFPDVESLPAAPDLAVICTPAGDRARL